MIIFYIVLTLIRCNFNFQVSLLMKCGPSLPSVYPAYLLTPTSYGEWGPRLARGGRGVIAAFKPRCAVLVVRAVNENSRRFYCAN